MKHPALPAHPVPRIRIRRPRRSTALLTSAALALTASTTAIAAYPPLLTTRTDAPCEPAPVDGVEMSEGIPTPDGVAPSTGTLRALTLMIDFPDAPGEGPAKERFDEFFPPTHDWYATSSYGALDYRAHAPIPHWLRMPRPFSAYGVDRGVSYEPHYRRLVADIAKAADDRVDFDRYDLINVLVTPNAGPSALEAVLSVTFASMDDAPEADGVRLTDVSFVYSRQDDGSATAGENAYRVLPHENAHALGLPDLYTSKGGGKAGHWDIMSEDWGPNNDFLGWHKRKLGWLGPDQVDCATGSGSSEHLLSPLARPDGTKLVYVPISAGTGLAIEARTQEGNDASVCKPGVLVYRVDASVDSGHGPITVMDSAPRSGGCAREPNAHPELTDAPFGVGETLTDDRTGVTIAVTGKDARDNYRVTVTRP